LEAIAAATVARRHLDARPKYYWIKADPPFNGLRQIINE
jgi:hypothetical protein